MFEYVVPGGDTGGYCLASGRLLLAGAAGLAPHIPRIWRVLAAPEAELDEVFAALTDRGVSAAPAFAIAEILDVDSREVRAIVHGGAVAQTESDPATRLSSSGLTTWREMRWHGAEFVMLGLDTAGPGLESLPLSGGIVRADWIRWRPEPVADAPETDAAVPAIRIGDGPPLGLELPLVLGRRPVAGLTPTGAPTVPVTVASPERLVSAQHLLIERAGAAVRLQDLGSTNGSSLRLSDGTQHALRGGADRTVPIGTVVELGEGILVEIVAQP